MDRETVSSCGTVAVRCPRRGGALAVLLLGWLAPAAAQPAADGGLAFVPQQALAVADIVAGRELLGGPARSAEAAGLVAGWLGVPPALVEEALLARPFTVALLPEQGGRPSVLMIFADGAETAVRLLREAARKGEPAGELAGHPVQAWRLPAPLDLPLLTLARGRHLLAATSLELLGQALTAEASPATASFLAGGEVRRALAGAGGRRAAFVHLAPGLLRGLFPGEGPQGLCWTARIEPSGARDRARLEWAGTGLAGLAGAGPWPAELAGLIPGNALAGLAASLDPGALAKALAEDSLARSLGERAGAATGFPWAALLPALTGRLALGWLPPAETGGAAGFLAALEVADADLLDRKLRDLAQASGRPAESVLSGYTVYQSSEGWPARVCWVVAGERLLLARTPGVLAGALAAAGVQGPAPAGEHLRLWGDPAALAGLLLGLARELPPRGLPAAATAGVAWGGLTAASRFEALVALERTGSVAACSDEVIALMADADPAVAARAAFALGRARVAEAGPALRAALRDGPHPLVRRYAAYALMEIGDRAAEEVLVAALNDEDEGARGFAATALERLQSRRAAKPLAEALVAFPEANAAGRTRILCALGEVGDPAAIPKVLLAVPCNAALELLNAQVYCLQRLTPQLAPGPEAELLAGLLDHPSIHVRRYSVERLAELGDDSALEPLRRRLEVEGAVLAPRLKLAMAAIEARHRTVRALKVAVTNTAGDVLKIREKALALLAGLQALPPARKAALVACPVLLAALVLLIRLGARRLAARRAAVKVASLVAPSAAPAGRRLQAPQAAPPPEDLEVSQVTLEDGREIESLVPMEEDGELPGLDWRGEEGAPAPAAEAGRS